MAPLSAIILANPKKTWSRKLGVSVGHFLEKRGVEVGAESASLAICIGGDGTILYNKAHYNKIIFGIGTQSSWICQSTRSNWKAKLGKFISAASKNKKNIKITSPRLVLAATLNGNRLPLALNDIAVKTTSHRIVRFMLKYGKNRAEFFADGLIFSTPTGSGAYAYSCGGKQVPYESKLYQVVAIAPYRRAFKPHTLKPSAICSLSFTCEGPLDIVVDGQNIFKAASGSSLIVRVAKTHVLFAKV